MGARKMVKLKVDETSGVDHPAHLEEGWIVMKSASKGAKVAKQPNVEIEIEAEEEDMNEEMDTEKAASEETDFEAMFAKMKEERDMYKGKYEELMKEMSPADEEAAMEKAMPDSVREMLNKARGEAEAARVELRKEVERRQDREYVAKAAAWSNLSLDAEEVGPMLRKMAETNGDLVDAVMGALSSANAQAEAANIFAELGTAHRPDSGDAFSRMTKMAKAAVDAGEHKTIEQAISALVVSNPELYDAYRQENR